MAWLAAYNSTAQQKIVDSEITYEDSIFWGGQNWTREVSVEQYRYIGMTEAAADAAIDALNNPPDLIASKKRENNAAAYMVEVSEITEGAWSV